MDGEWLCDCQPRQRASHFQTKAETENKGRWFYTCRKRKSDPGSCGFFLWEDIAKGREAGAASSSSRSEPRRNPDTTPSRPPRQMRTASPPPPYRSPNYDRATTPRRKRDRSSAEDDEEFGWPVTASEESLLAREADGAAAHRESPRKAARTDSYTTPHRRRLPWLENNTPNGLPTPNTSHTTHNPFTPNASTSLRNPRMTPSSGRRQDEERILNGYTLPTLDLPTLDSTPTPNRFREAEVDDTDDASLATDIFDALREENVTLDENAEKALKGVIAKHSLRIQGIIKGRDISRLAIRAKDAKITELHHRAATLEAELETEKALVEHLRWEAATGHRSRV